MKRNRILTIGLIFIELALLLMPTNAISADSNQTSLKNVTGTAYLDDLSGSFKGTIYDNIIKGRIYCNGLKINVKIKLDSVRHIFYGTASCMTFSYNIIGLYLEYNYLIYGIWRIMDYGGNLKLRIDN